MENIKHGKTTIIYIHGFRSDGASSKPQKIQTLLPNYKVVSDSFSANPSLVLDHLKELHEAADGDVIFMGTSMGGFYALYAGIKFGCKSYSINPSLLPHLTLRTKVGDYKTYNLEHEYNFRSAYIDVLNDMHHGLFKSLDKSEYKPKVIFNEDDDVIHHSLFGDYKKYFDLKYYASGGHRATNIEKIIWDLKL